MLPLASVPEVAIRRRVRIVKLRRAPLTQESTRPRSYSCADEVNLMISTMKKKEIREYNAPCFLVIDGRIVVSLIVSSVRLVTLLANCA